MLMVNQLCGFGSGGLEALTSVVQQASATSTSSTINAPADIMAGDLLVLSDRAGTLAAIPATAVPSFFTTISNVGFESSATFTGFRQIISYKIADGSEASASLTGMNGGSSNRKVLLVFRPNVSATLATPNTFSGTSTDGNPGSQSVTASGGVPPLIVFGVYGSSGTIDPRTFTVSGSPAKDGEVGVSNTLYLAWKIYNSSPANASLDMDDEGGGNLLQSGYIALA